MTVNRCVISRLSFSAVLFSALLSSLGCAGNSAPTVESVKPLNADGISYATERAAVTGIRAAEIADETTKKVTVKTGDAASRRNLSVGVVSIFPFASNTRPPVTHENLERLTELLRREFSVNTTLEIMPQKALSGAEQLDALLREGSQQDSVNKLAERALAFGRRSGSDAVLYGVVSRFLEANDPSLDDGIAFRVWLIDTRTGKELWTYGFGEQERSYAEDLTQIPKTGKSRLTRRSVFDLLRDGAKEGAKVLESDRQ